MINKKKNHEKNTIRPVVIIYEEDQSTTDIVRVLQQNEIPFELANVSDFDFDPTYKARKDCLYYNRVSSSCLNRGHEGAPSMARTLIRWLESQGCSIINGLKAFELEMNKSKQIMELNNFGIRVPKTVCCVGKDALLRAFEQFSPKQKIIVKPNQGGMGQSVHVFDAPELARRHFLFQRVINANSMWTVQEYIKGKLIQEDINSNHTTILRSSKKVRFANPVMNIMSNKITANNDLRKLQTANQIWTNIAIGRSIRSGLDLTGRPIVKGKPILKIAPPNNIENISLIHQKNPTSIQLPIKPLDANQNSTREQDYAYRLEIIGKIILYVLRVDCSKGFDICPSMSKKEDNRFRIILHPEKELPMSKQEYINFSKKCMELCVHNKIDTCSIEFKIDEKGIPIAYGLNLDTIYSNYVEQEADKNYPKEYVPRGWYVLTDYFKDRLESLN